MKDLFKKIWPDAAAILFFLLLSLAYFFTPATQGLVLSGADNSAGIGLGQEIAHHQETTGEMTRWTNAIFGGMPTFQIAPNYSSRTALSTIRNIYELGLSGALMLVFILLLGFYILMRSLNFKPTISVLGAIAWAFSSYFFIIIGAGHIWKVLTLAFIPPTIAGMVLCYKGKYLWGGAITALFFAFQILSNHLQMTYYFGFLMVLLFIGYLVQAVRQHTIPQFLKSTGIFVVAILIGLAVNLPSLYHTYEYSKESMRGKVSLSSASTQQRQGLSPDYITQWSYGIGETWTLLVPNVKGGASVPIALNEKAMEKANPQYQQIYQQIGQYWGEQPGTSGPVYVGAFIMLLFVLGLFIVKGPMKWCLLGATILSILLSWGHNFMGLTEFFINYVPLYNKFRTVASILVVAEFTIPFLAIIALAKIIDEPDLIQKNSKKFYLSFALTGGIALLFALFPTMFFPSYMSSNETAQLNQVFADNPNVLQEITSNLSEMRRAIFVSDAWRSFFVILIGFAFLLAYAFKKVKGLTTVICCTLLCIVDLYQVNKRYLNDNNFVEETQQTRDFAETNADKMILQDKSLDYRVLNLTKSTFNENETAFYHKSIGGYHPAKLGRYQDLIVNCLSPEIQAVISGIQQCKGEYSDIDFAHLCPVINMLNTKYFILSPDFAMPNSAAYGNAWFVNNIQFVNTPNEEMQALKSINPRTTAVADAQFKTVFNGATAPADTLSAVRLTSYAANELHYETQSSTGGIVVFSEIYYPGWKATIDGKPLELGRVDYVLRAAYVPAGNHKIMMEFRPASVEVTETIAYIALALLILLFAAAAYVSFRTKKSSN